MLNSETHFKVANCKNILHRLLYYYGIKVTHKFNLCSNCLIVIIIKLLFSYKYYFPFLGPFKFHSISRNPLPTA